MPIWLHTLIWIFAIYIVISVLLYYFQDQFLFKPEKLPKDFLFEYENQQVEEYNLETTDGAIINGLHFKTINPKGVVLYLKGNSKSIKGWGKFAVDFTRNYYDVIMVDYRGFGKSTGKRSQEAIKRDLQYVYNKIKQRVPEKYIILYGRSLGSGFATKLASINKPKMLILDAPYYSLLSVTGRYMPFMPLSILLKYPMPTHKWLQYVKCPVHIIHGTNDKLIPFKSSIKLAQIQPFNTQLYPIVGGGHKNMNTFASYHLILTQIIQEQLIDVDLSTTSIGVKHSYK
ncbi:alpha/beta hydrolase [Patiriisocius marinistellae]|uniref:Alpha/beta hydrolase n=1 Tax=Patiriisocius marinistellae TaxID=2494560 RepID=A0A5J4G1J0_9FLAO|nr:alpha/beta fold hydrolase [Patiriisocius marinistellae]GEQ86529.1 alpha/beta hydrolase [Patiriisocius marinistellae]